MSTLIFLHGASSSGKSTLAAAIRNLSDRPYVHLSLDHFRDSGAIDPRGYPDWITARRSIFDGLHRSFAAFADTGNDLIIEHILDTPGWHESLQRILTDHLVVFVGLMTPESTLNIREDIRGDRPFGSAIKDARHIHQGLFYDLVLDGTHSPDDNAQKVQAVVANPPPHRSAFFKSHTSGS